MERQREIYQPKQKLYGERAERMNQEELALATTEVIDKAKDKFEALQGTEQLSDKESFGDIDIVGIASGELTRDVFLEIFGEQLLEYKRNGHIYSLLVALERGKSVQVDFIAARDDEDFERKKTYYSKGHISAMIGIFAKKLNFKYGTEGFFKRFRDKRGNWHEILVSGDLRDGLRIMGLNADAYETVHTNDDIVRFVSGSPLFSSEYFKFENLVQRDKRAFRKVSAQRYIIDSLVALENTRIIDDPDIFLRQLFPEKFNEFQKRTEEIERIMYTRSKINGELVMRTLGLEHGPLVGKVIKFITDTYPDIEELTPEVVERVKKEFLV